MKKVLREKLLENVIKKIKIHPHGMYETDKKLSEEIGVSIYYIKKARSIIIDEEVKEMLLNF